VREPGVPLLDGIISFILKKKERFLNIIPHPVASKVMSRMNLIELTQYTQSELAAEEYLPRVGILRTFTECPYCKGERIGKIRRGLGKCYHCRKEWSRRRGSRFEKSRVPYQKVLLAIKLF
jgi:transposase-like protein